MFGALKDDAVDVMASFIFHLRHGQRESRQVGGILQVVTLLLRLLQQILLSALDNILVGRVKG
ncbi:hypothetical protein D3C72_2364310 [compost metagenome]